MEDLLSIFGSGGIWLSWVPGFGHAGDLPSGTLLVSIIFAGVGALILSKFTCDLGALTLPVNYISLLVGALLANWGLGRIHLPFAGDFQRPIIFALAGMTIAGLVMMAILRKSSA